MRWRWLILGTLAVLALLVACGTQSPATTVSVHWTVVSVSTKSATGELVRADVTGYFIFTSALQPALAQDGTQPAASGTFEQDLTLSSVRITQASTYTATTKTLTLTIGPQPQSFAYSITTSGPTHTMTWDSQDATQAHWVLVATDLVDAGGGDTSTEGSADGS